MESFTEQFMHMVWATHGRLPLITPEVRGALHPYLVHLAQTVHCRVLAVGSVPDHVHVVVRIHPATSVARLAQELKGVSSHYINHAFKSDPPRLLWQGGYGAFSFWRRDLKVLIRYTQTQRARHEHEHWLRMTESWGATDSGFGAPCGNAAESEAGRTPLLERISGQLLLVDEWEQTHRDEDPTRCEKEESVASGS
jgi:putative transposase